MVEDAGEDVLGKKFSEQRPLMTGRGFDRVDGGGLPYPTFCHGRPLVLDVLELAETNVSTYAPTPRTIQITSILLAHPNSYTLVLVFI